MSSGYISGAAITGVILAGLTIMGMDTKIDFSSYSTYLSSADWFSLIPFLDSHVYPVQNWCG